MIPFVLARVAVILLLLWTADSHPEAMFAELLWLVFAVAVTGAVQGARFRQYGWVGTMAVLSFVFNPLLPLELGRSVWSTVDYVAALLLLISLPTLRRH